MAASMLSRVSVTLRTPGLCSVVWRVQHYSNGLPDKERRKGKAFGVCGDKSSQHAPYLPKEGTVTSSMPSTCIRRDYNFHHARYQYQGDNNPQYALCLHQDYSSKRASYLSQEGQQLIHLLFQWDYNSQLQWDYNSQHFDFNTLLQVFAPRTERMPPDQDWTSVYPTAASFKPSAVPLPVRMGYPVKMRAPPDKYGNLELVKIPNFLHLTPLAITKHCAALKEFCTEWPAALSDDDQCKQHFPLELQSVDFVFAGPSIRNPKARVVTLQIKLSSLNLDKHGRRKLIKLVGSRYNEENDTLTIQTDRCPLRRQNEDYAMYLLTVLYHESSKTEAWENEKEEGDMDEYIWEGSRSEKNVLQVLSKFHDASTSSEEILQSPSVQEYRSAMLNLRNEGETEDSISAYKQSVKQMLGFA
ncbi:PREDICTED: 28S ribosomal protein S35, mitochondrial [Nanorana parkeri]|uniref:28S ribosomal protein S35, mitochondrial n=1 Tax=Nanorana parkeri TaxID=125878 RepID=UPI000854761D|nr:PREDICTED: 28S ribosomal protein S35, mitochondrial [Nanorana parkeri]